MGESNLHGPAATTDTPLPAICNRLPQLLAGTVGTYEPATGHVQSMFWISASLRSGWLLYFQQMTQLCATDSRRYLLPVTQLAMPRYCTACSR